MVRIIKGLSFWLLIMYIGFNLRFIANGQLLLGSIGCLMFGVAISYLVEAHDCWKKKRKFGTLLDLYLSGWFMYLWYITIKATSDIMITVTPYFNHNPTGLFGITGFWGVGIIIPIYAVLIFCIITIIMPFMDWLDYHNTYNKDDYYAGKVFIDSIFKKEKKDEKILL